MEDYKKKYEEALERAKELQRQVKNNETILVNSDLETIFPELKESEDEKIRKELINAIKSSAQFGSCLQKHGFDIKEVLSWLEKQGEQKPADNAEPKFKVNDWITNGECTWKVTAIKQLDYILQSQNGDTVDDTMSHVDEHFHLWTIQDAEDCDVLYCKTSDVEIIAMYQRINIHNNVDSYCRYNSNLGFNTYITNVLDAEHDFITPATKEQRDFLFQKMKEVGCEWDAEKKELKEIEQEPAELSNGEDCGIDGMYAAIDILQKTLGEVEGYQSDDGILEHKCAINAIKKLYEQKPAWSEEDKCMCSAAIELLITHPGLMASYSISKDSIINWLKSLKDKMYPQPNQEWSEEEDIRNIQDIDSVLFYDRRLPEDTRMRLRNWVKSLKDRIQPKQEWSEEDEENLNGIIKYFDSHIPASASDWIDWLKSLKDGMKGK